MRIALIVFTASALALAAAPAARIDAAGPAASPTPVRPPSAEHLGLAGLPCDFEENLGQTAPEVDYVARCRGYVAFLTHGDAVIRTGADAVRLRVTDGRAAEPVASKPRPGRSHHFLGSDPSKAVTGVRHSGEVAYRGVLPGVDLVWRTAGRELAFDVHVAACADPASVRFTVDGAKWLGPDASGELAIGLPSGGTARLTAPRAWQENGASRRPVTVAFAQGARADEFGFDVGPRDPALPLVIDPGLSVSTFLGGSSVEKFNSLRTDSQGAIYVAGNTLSLDYPVVAGSLQTTKGEPNSIYADGYVTKFDATGTQLVWSTYLGGSNNDTVWDIAIGASGDVFAGGNTNSPNYPLLNAYQTTVANGFLTRISASGSSLVWSTYYQYPAHKIGLDASENVHCHYTSVSRKFAFNSAGTTLLHSVPVDAFSPPTFTFTSFAVLPSGEAWIGGGVSSHATNFSMPGALQGSQGGSADGWLVRVNASGSVVYRSYVGGSNDDRIMGLATDAAGNLYVCGYTTGTFPLVNPAQVDKGGGQNGFVMKLNPAGSAASFSTYYGGANDTTLGCIATNASGHVFVGGSMVGVGLPTVDPYQPAFAGGNSDGVIAEYDAQGALVRSTYLGGTSTESVTAIAAGANGRPVVGGITESADFPLACGVQSTLRGGYDLFVASVTTGAQFSVAASDQMLADGTVGRSYSRPLVVSGGEAPVTFSLDSGALPPGLGLSASGVLSGTPTSTANAVMNVKVRDAHGQCMVKEFRAVVNAAPSVPDARLASWTATRVYSAVLPRSGGTPPLVWDVASGSVPPGLLLSAAGVLSGTPTAAGNYAFDARLTDANGAVEQGTMLVTVNAVPAITTTALAEWTTGRAYSQPIGLADGTPPFVWTISQGALPAGAAIDPVTGTVGAGALPTGDSAFSLLATDAAGATASRALTLHVNPVPVLLTERMPIAAAGRPYAVTLDAAGGTRPFTWTLTSGTFGAGFDGIDQEGRVLGTPASEGTSTATIRLRDATGASAQKSLSLTVAAGADIATGKFVVTQGSGGEDLVRYVELLAGTALDVKASVPRGSPFAIDVLLLDSAESPLQLGSFKKSKDPAVSVKKFPVPYTGRYLVVVQQLEGSTGGVTLEIAATAQTKKAGTGLVDPAGSGLAVHFAAQPGSLLQLGVSAAKKSAAVPAIVSLTDATGAEILDPADVRPGRKGATLKTSQPLAGGDYVATFAADAGAAGDVKWALSLKAPKGYAFSLPSLPVTGE